MRSAEWMAKTACIHYFSHTVCAYHRRRTETDAKFRSFVSVYLAAAWLTQNERALCLVSAFGYIHRNCAPPLYKWCAFHRRKIHSISPHRVEQLTKEKKKNWIAVACDKRNLREKKRNIFCFRFVGGFRWCWLKLLPKWWRRGDQTQRRKTSARRCIQCEVLPTQKEVGICLESVLAWAAGGCRRKVAGKGHSIEPSYVWAMRPVSLQLFAIIRAGDLAPIQSWMR